MVKSFHQFKSDAIQFFLVVPETDLELFAPLSGESVTLLSEQLMVGHLVDHEVHGMRPGYINQEIVKLSFWELGLAQNYFCVDSDAEFIRPFGVADFMFDSVAPYSVLVQDLELAVEPEYYNQYWVSREAELRRIAELVGMDSRVVLTCHGHTVFHVLFWSHSSMIFWLPEIGRMRTHWNSLPMNSPGTTCGCKNQV